MSPPVPSSRVKTLLRAGLTLLVLGLVYLFLRRLRWAETQAALGRADWRLVALAALVNLGPNTTARVLRWWTLLGALPHPASGRGARPGELAALHLASSAAGNVLPARFNEVLRVAALYRRHGYPLGALLATQLLDRCFDAFSMALLALFALATAVAPPATRGALWGYATVGLGAMAVPLVLAHLVPRLVKPATATAAVPVKPPWWSPRLWLASLAALFERLGDALQRLHTGRVWLGSLGWSLFSDACDATMLGLCLAAVHAPLGGLGVIMGYVSLNLMTIIPLTPAQVGIVEVAAVTALGLLGVPAEAALAAGILYHAAHVIPITGLGLLLVRRELVR